MTEQIKQKFEDELKKLPKEIGEVINSHDWATETEKIGLKYLLLEEGINDLQIETSLVLLGMEDPDSFSNNIENNVGLSKNEANKINEEISKLIFEPIINEIAKKMKVDISQKNKIKGGWEDNVDYILDH